MCNLRDVFSIDNNHLRDTNKIIDYWLRKTLIKMLLNNKDLLYLYSINIKHNTIAII